MKFIFINKQFRFMTDYTGFSGFLNEKNVLQNLRYSFVTFSIILRCSSLVPPLISRLLLVRSSFVLRLIFDRSSIDNRRMNEGRTKNEREPNEERTRSYREPNEKLSLRFEVHFIHYMQHCIARHSVVPCLGASLRVDYLANV